MIYPNNFEQKIGFDKVRALIATYTLSNLGKERVDSISFQTKCEPINRQLYETEEMLRIVQFEDNFPANYFFDLRESLQRIRIEGLFLDENELFNLRRSLETIHDLVLFFRREEMNERYPTLFELSEKVSLLPEVTLRIDRILDKLGKIKDNASPELAQIRREISQSTAQISKTLNSILRSAQAEGAVDKDVSPTMRDGRLVIPVIPAFKRKIKGIVHDESATGKTVYIEPEAVVEANNRIRELEAGERREIIRILTEISNFLRPSIPLLQQSFYFLGEIDFIRAKALFAKEVNAIRPHLENQPILYWHDAIHPLLFLSLRKQNKPIVPLDIDLDFKNRLLIISGPNAGGKSVCLKTVGLLQYMLQCGLLVPLHETSKAGLFSDIFIDIGDEQSIENDLSTYSSHLTNMKHFVRNCNSLSLILIDEFGGGTEPQIGGAIAESLLERFNQNGSYGVITTHYHNLKHYAEDHAGIVNGAMLYDRHEMRPHFKLAIGNPGSSFAIEIARKIGLPEEVITDASNKVGADYVNMDKYLQDIVRDKRYWEVKRQEVRKKEKQLEELTESYQLQVDGFEKERKQLLKESKAVAEETLRQANALIENTIRKIKEAQAEKQATRLARQELDDFKVQLASDLAEKERAVQKKMVQIQAKQQRKDEKKNLDKSKLKIEKKQMNTKIRSITISDTVRIKGQTTVGEVLEVSGKKAIVAFDFLKTSVELHRLELAEPSTQNKSSQATSFVTAATQSEIREKKLNFRQDIDVRGMRGDEALQAVTYFIDDAILVGIQRVRILHGTGSGILRQLIRDYLSKVHGIVSFQDEHVQFGGTGITVVDLE